MLASLRSLSNSRIGTTIAVGFILLILIGFGLSDVSNLRSSAFGLGSGTIAEAGNREVTDADISKAATRAVGAMRQQNPGAGYADLAPQFSDLVDAMVDETALQAFGDKAGFNLSKRLVDAAIVRIPGTRGLDGKFSDSAYAGFLAQRQMTDAEVRRLLSADLTRRLILVPAAAEARMPIGVATPYAAMQLERRQGEIALLPTAAFKAGLAPSSGDLTAYYAANKGRYMVPEQRVLRFAAITPSALAAAGPSDAAIAAYYRKHQSQYAARSERELTQLVAHDQASGGAAAAAARSGALPGGIALGAKDRAAFSAIAGDQVAAVVFAAPQGAVVGPIRSDLGWHVVKVGAVHDVTGKTLAQARPEIVTALAASTRDKALADAVKKVGDAIDGGAGFDDAARANGLIAVTTPALAVDGKSRADPGYQLPAGYQTAVSSGFDLESNDPPVVETLPNKAGFVLVGVRQIMPAAPAPIAAIEPQLKADWISRKAADRAKAAATDLAAKVARGVPLAEALGQVGVKLPPPLPINVQRFQLANAKGPAQLALNMMFTLAEGKSRLVADPAGQAYVVVRTDKIIPGTTMANASLIAQTAAAFTQPLGDELAREFLGAIKQDVKMRRNEAGIAAARTRITAPASSR